MNITNVSRSIFVPFGGDNKNYQPIYQTLVFTSSFFHTKTIALSDNINFNSYFLIHIPHFHGIINDKLTFIDSYPLHDIDFLFNKLSFTDSYPLHDIFFFFPRITFIQSFTKYVTYQRSLSDSLNFTDHFSFIETVFTEPFTNVIDFVERYVVSYVTITPFNNVLSFTDTFLTSNSTYHLSLGDKLNFSEVSFDNTFDNNIIPTPVWIVNKVCGTYYSDGIYTYANKFIYLTSFSSAIQLDSPIFGDLQANVNEVIINRTVGGARYTHVKKSQRKHLKYEFSLRCDKYQQLQNFVDASILEWITLTNWKNESWMVKIVNEPVIIKASSRDIVTIVLEFEGYRTNVGLYNCLE